MKLVRYCFRWLQYLQAGLVFGRACHLFPGAPYLGLWQGKIEAMRPKWGDR